MTEHTNDQEPEETNSAPDHQSPQGNNQFENALEYQIDLKNQKALKKKKRMRYGLITGGIALIVYLVQWGLAPHKGTMAYGLCKVFLELNVQYPESLYISTVEELGKSVRIWYTQVDSFGEYRMEPIQCYFKEDLTYGFVLDKVTVRRREVDHTKVEQFNKSIGAILQNPPDLSLPKPLPDSLKNLQTQ